MKKVYRKPMLEIECYALNQSIALNCDTIVTLGPGTDTIATCKEFEGSFDVEFSGGLSVMSAFYESGDGYCDCYYSSSGQGYFTS